MNSKIKFLFLGTLALVGLFASVTPAYAQTVTPTCNNAVWSTTLYGTVTPNGTATQAWFEWGTNTSLSYATPRQTFSVTSSYSQVLTPLAENTTYYWRSMAQNQYGTATGSILSFSTGTCSQPVTPASVVLLPSSQTIYSTSGNVAILSWSGTNISSCSGTAPTPNWNGSTATTGSKGVSPTSTTTYTISCISTVGGSNPTATAVVNVINNTPVPIDGGWSSWSPQDYTCGTSGVQTRTCTNPAPANGGAYCSGPSTQSYTNASCSTVVNGGWSSWSPQDYTCGTSGVQTRTCTNPAPANGGAYCSGPSTQSYTNASCSTTNYQQPTPVVSIYANPSSVSYNGASTVTWNSQNAVYCSGTIGVNGWAGTRNTSGTFYTGALTYSTSFLITCTNSTGQSGYASTTVNVDTYQQASVQPSVVTYNATNITTSSATLNGFVNGSGLYTTAWFAYGTNTNFGYTTNQNSYGSGYSNYNAPISGLSPNTTYYFRAIAQSSQGLIYGETLSFNTTNNYVNTNSQPTVLLFSDQTSVPYNGATTVRWITTNATYCFASQGSVGWAGTKSIGPGSFFTGSLTGTRTYELTCSNSVGSASDRTTVTVRGQVLGATTVAPTSLVLITSSVDRNQPIVPTIDNTRPRPGDEINYTVSYQNIGNASITGLSLQINLPLEVDYISSNPNNPTMYGNSLTFNLGTLRANGKGTVTIRTRVKDNIADGTNLNFPATLSYIDPSGNPQSVSANVSAQVWNEKGEKTSSFGANAFWFGSFLPGSLLGWLLLLILISMCILLAKNILTDQNFKKKTTTIVQ